MSTGQNLLQRLRFDHPIIQAPMAGGGDTPDLVAAVCSAGALGFIGGAYLTPQQIVEASRAVRAKTSRPFGINLFAPQLPAESGISAEAAIERLGGYYAELGLQAPAQSETSSYTLGEQLIVALESGASAFSFTFGIFPADAIAAIRERGMLSMGTATTVDEAIALEKAGVDAVIAQGSEAGGHRGTFSGDFSAAMIGTISLVPQMVDAVRLPVVASGGIMDGRGIAAALALGASAVQLGTAFLTCDEAGIPDAYKKAIQLAHEDQTRVTRCFSGRPARGIVNRFMSEMESAGSAETILPFPLQNSLTRPLRSAAAQQGRAEFLSLWAGQGVRMARQEPAAKLVARLVRETETAIGQMRGAASSHKVREKTRSAHH
jgi:nitronate monooxygenase